MLSKIKKKIFAPIDKIIDMTLIFLGSLFTVPLGKGLVLCVWVANLIPRWVDRYLRNAPPALKRARQGHPAQTPAPAPPPAQPPQNTTGSMIASVIVWVVVGFVCWMGISLVAGVIALLHSSPLAWEATGRLLKIVAMGTLIYAVAALIGVIVRFTADFLMRNT